MIPNKAKNCKGTGKAIGHGCGSPQIHRKYGLGLKCGCFRDWLLNSDEGNKTLKKTQLRASVKVKKEKNKEAREYKEANKSIAKLKQEARKVFQQWVRVRDSNLQCVCCGKDSETWDGGHFYKAELYSGVIFNPINVNKQSVYCNQHLHGNEGEYRKGLIKKYGAEAVLNLDQLAKDTRNKKWSREELNDIKLKYKLKLKNNDFENEY